MEKDFFSGTRLNTTAVKRINEIRILQMLYWEGELTQTELRQKLTLSPPTITQAVQMFRKCGILTDGAELESSGGRKPRKIAFLYQAFHAAGVEIRPHHIEVVIIDMKGRVEGSETYRLDYENTPAYWAAINACIKNVLNHLPNVHSLLGVGIAFPGEVSFNGNLIERATVLGLYNEPLDNIKRHFDYDVYIENGANTAGFGAIWRDQANTDAVYIVVTDDGVAGAVILNGQIYRGSGKAGAFGHMTLDPNGRQCFCGAKGCWTAYCAMSNLSSLTGGDLDAFFAKKDGDKRLQTAWDEYLTSFARALSIILLSMDVDIIIGGKLARYLRSALGALQEKIQEHPVLRNERFNIRLDDIKENTLAVGAALIFVRKFLDGKIPFDLAESEEGEREVIGS